MLAQLTLIQAVRRGSVPICTDGACEAFEKYSNMLRYHHASLDLKKYTLTDLTESFVRNRQSNKSNLYQMCILLKIKAEETAANSTLGSLMSPLQKKEAGVSLCVIPPAS